MWWTPGPRWALCGKASRLAVTRAQLFVFNSCMSSRLPGCALAVVAANVAKVSCNLEAEMNWRWCVCVCVVSSVERDREPGGRKRLRERRQLLQHKVPVHGDREHPRHEEQPAENAGRWNYCALFGWVHASDAETKMFMLKKTWLSTKRGILNHDFSHELEKNHSNYINSFGQIFSWSMKQKCLIFLLFFFSHLT